MRKIVAFLFFVLLSVSTVLAQNNTVVFDNQSGESALVKLIGPTDREVEVATGAKGTVTTAAGRYHIKVRYGTPGKYYYAKGEEFEVKETATSKSETTITLHKVVAGNYDSRPITETEFQGGHLSPEISQKPEKAARQPDKSGNMIAGPWEIEVLSFDTKKSFTQKTPAGEVNLAPKGNNVVALIGIRCKRVRDYSQTEEDAIQKLSTWKLVEAGRKLTGKQSFLATSCFMLTYIYPKDNKRRVMLSACRSLGDSTSQLFCVYDRTASSIVGIPESDQIETTLVFVYDPRDKDPILLFWPIPHKKECKAARISLTQGGKFNVEYGDAAEMRKYMPAELRSDKK